MLNVKILEPRIEADDASPVFSHKSFEPDVHAICHHSGAYLTRGETNPVPGALLREQHDFPGLPKLDSSFAAAAHAREHQHLAWSPVAIKAFGVILSALLIGGLVAATMQYEDYMPAGLLLAAFRFLLVACALAAIGLFLWGISLLARRHELFHAAARGLPPATPDYPIAAAYEIAAVERLWADIGNGLPDVARVTDQRCALTIRVLPETNELEPYSEYRATYAGHDVGEYARAGVVALDGLLRIALDDGCEHGHRLVLKKPAAEVIRDDVPQPFEISTAYEVLPDALEEEIGGERRFLLECRPEFKPADSRTLVVRFEWRGPTDLPNLGIDYCALTVPPDLKTLRVKAGRYDPERNEVIWRNLAFRDGGLELEVTFAQPITGYAAGLSGRYSLSFDGLFSGLRIEPERVWTALGLKARPESVMIRKTAVLSGAVSLNPRRLAYEHEHVAGISLVAEGAPDDAVVLGITQVLQDRGIDLMRIVECAPRLNPAGALDSRLHYWEISGRGVDQNRLDAYDVHVVVTGQAVDPLARASDGRPSSSRIDLRVRCAHDPRNMVTPQMAEDLLCRPDQDGLDLAERIKREIAVVRERR